MDHRFQWTVLQAAVRHAQRPEVQQEPKAAVLQYLRSTATALIKANHYAVAYEALSVYKSIENLGSVNAVYKLLRAEFGNDQASIPSQPTPASNTGVTPKQASILEEYINGHG